MIDKLAFLMLAISAMPLLITIFSWIAADVYEAVRGKHRHDKQNQKVSKQHKK